MPKRQPGRPRKDQISAADSRKLSPEQALQQARDLVVMTSKDADEKDRHSMFPSVKKMIGDRINSVAALRLAGYWDKEVEDHLSLNLGEVNRLETKYPNEMALAETHLLSMAQHKMEVNVWRTRAAAAKRAEEMLNVLTELATSPNEDVKPHIRRECAVNVLNLLGMNLPVAKGGADKELNKGTLVAIQQVFSDKDGPTTVVDGEVVDD